MKSTELNIIDYSVLKTMSKGGDYCTFENIVSALLNYIIYNNPNGFTKLDDARNYIMSLTKDDIEKELLKNIIKKNFCAIYNNYELKIKTNKKTSDNLSISDIEVLIFNSLSTMNMNEIKYIIKKYIKLIIKSFVETRYFDDNYKIEKLDNKDIITNECNKLLNMIDDYYQKLHDSKKLIS